MLDLERSKQCWLALPADTDGEPGSVVLKGNQVMELLDPDDVEARWQDIVSQLDTTTRLIVHGPTGSGRTLILERLASRCFICADPPPLNDTDASLHALTQLASALGEEGIAIAHDGARPLRERAHEIARRLADGQRSIALRMPSSWKLGGESESRDGPDSAVWRRSAIQILDALCEQEAIKIILLVASPRDLHFDTSPRTSPWTRINLGPRRIAASALNDLSGFANYEPAARFVAQAIKRASRLPSPLQFRVAVALRALGRFGERDTELLEPSVSGSVVLENRLVRALAAAPDLGRAAYRFALARRPLTRTQTLAIAELEPEHEPLLTQCLAYGHDTVRMHERIRDAVQHLGRERALRKELREVTPAAHHHLARIHASADGTSNVIQSRNPLAWLERAHHLAGSGSLGRDEWNALELTSRELYWDRARSLSLSGSRLEAADVYRKCLSLFGADDDYAQHYLGFNLDRAGQPTKEAMDAYRQAVALDGDNPWWNARLVTALIDQALFVSARRQWLIALENVDPTGERVIRDGWLALNLHRWVVQSWLDQGEVEFAREAFDAIPPSVVESADALRLLEERLLDAEEARDLGESVYPASVSASERWLHPRHLKDVNDRGSPLRTWYPGRVVSTSDEGVVIVFAVPDPDPDRRRVKLRDMTTGEWDAFSDARPEGFVEIGTYADGSTVILPINDPVPAWANPVDAELELRHLGLWNESRH